MEIKEIYNVPTMDVIHFEVEDIITTSTTGSNSGNGIVLPDDEW